MAFCLPFSTALTLFFSALGVLFGLLGFDLSSFKQAIRHPISMLCVGLFAWLALSTLWSIAPPDELTEGMWKYRKLLYVPLVTMLFISTRVKPWFLMNFFVIGCLVVCVGSLTSSSGLMGYLIGPQLPGGGWGMGGTPAKHWFYIGPPEAPTFGRAWIAQGAFLVFSFTYLVGLTVAAFMRGKTPAARWKGFVFLGVAALLTYVVLNLGGRTGYLLLILSALIWMLILLRWRMKIAMLSVLSGLVVVGGVHLSTTPRVIDRFASAVQDVESYQQSGALTSQGMRLRFWEAGIRLGMDKPFFGWGVGSYPEVFSRDNQQPPQLRASRPHPHSEYVLQFVQGGALALVALAGLFVLSAALVISRSRERSPHTLIFAGLSLPCFLLLIDGLFNSIIWDLGEGHALVFLISPLASAMRKNEECC